MYRLTTSALTCLLVGAALASPSTQNSKKSDKCPEGLQMIISRGTGEQPGTGATGKLGEAIVKQIPGSAIHATDYPASYDNPIYFTSVAEGTDNVGETIKRFTTQCPDTKLAVLGYSQGAQITSNNICGEPPIWAASNLMGMGASGVAAGKIDVTTLGKPLDKKDTKNIVAVVLFGDPTHNAKSSYNHGTSKGNGLFYRAYDDACEDLGDRIRSYCDQGDAFCDIETVPDLQTHTSYIQTYGEEAVRFVVDQYKYRSGIETDPSKEKFTHGVFR